MFSNMTEFKTYQGGFRKLIAWKEAHMLALMIYKETQKFPDHEKFGLTSQLRRASSSVSANIAEGSGRSSVKDKAHFYIIARGSLVETDNFLELAHDLKYITDEVYADLLKQVNKVGYLLSKLLHPQS
jgi:four helix bundle protein